MINTVAEFVKAAKKLDTDAIYDLFEDNTSDAVRDEIYSLADPDSSEPMRDAMIKLGFTDF